MNDARTEHIATAAMLPFVLQAEADADGNAGAGAGSHAGAGTSAAHQRMSWPLAGAPLHFAASLTALLQRYCGHERFALLLDDGDGGARIAEIAIDGGCTAGQLARQLAAHSAWHGAQPAQAIRLDLHADGQRRRLSGIDGLRLSLHAGGGYVTLSAHAPARLLRTADLTALLVQWGQLAETLHGWQGDVRHAPLLTGALAHAALMRWSVPARAAPATLSLRQRFVRVAARCAASPALSDEHETLSFGQLAQRAAAIGAALRAHGIVAGARVALHLPRSATSVATLLALLELEAVYVPVDPAYPAAYIGAILDSSAPALILSGRAHAAGLPPHRAQLLCVEDIDLSGSGSGSAGAARQAGAAADDAGGAGAPAMADLSAPFAMLFTSGSSGAPKAVLHGQLSFVRRFEWMWEQLPVAPGEVFAQRTASGFGPHIWESLGGLLQGAHTVIVSDAAAKDPRRLVQVLAQHRVTRVGFVPSLLRVLLHSGQDLAGALPQLRVCSLGGEPLTDQLYRALRLALPHTQVYIDFGSTEINGIFFGDAAARAPGELAFPLGWPAPHARVFVLDARQQPVPPGVPGELYVGGATLALGYRQNDGSMVPVAVQRVRGVDCPVFNTGDRVRYLPDGRLISLGRADNQVKVRGMRVNLLQVATMLETLPELALCHVFMAKKSNGEERLAALVQTPAGTTTAAAYAAARRLLPSHMVPDEIRLTERMPRLPNGKLDRLAAQRQFAALAPAPSLTQEQAQEQMQARGAADDVGATLRALIAQVGEHPIGPLDDIDQTGIGDLGIDSLAVTELSLAIGARLHLDVTATQMFACDTFGSLVAYVRQRLDGGGAVIAAGAQLARDRVQLGAAVEALAYADHVAAGGATLVTGATGFLGVHVLDEVLRRSADPVVCLVRAAGPEAGWNKLSNAALTYGLSLQGRRERISVVTGDMALPRLGLGEHDYAGLAGGVQRIFHCAATVNHLAGYSSLRPANVLGTLALLELAAAGQCKHVVFASTIGVCLMNSEPGAGSQSGSASNDTGGAGVPESLSDDGARIASAYGQSKWLAEHLLWRYAERSGAGVSLFRIGEIAGHSLTGMGRHDDIFHHAIKLFVDTGVAPHWPDGVIDLMPVDVVARILVATGLGPQGAPRIYHLTHPRPWPIDQFFRLTMPQACAQPVELHSWRAAMARQYGGHPDAYLRGLAALVHAAPGELSIESYFQPLALQQTQCRALLASLDIALPPIDSGLWNRYLQQLERQGFLRRPPPRARAA